MYPQSARLYHYISAPRAKLDEAGHAVVLAVSGVAAVLDLTTLPPQKVNLKVGLKAQLQGALDTYVTLLADGADVGVIFGAAKADVTGANAPLIGQAGAVDGDGVYTPHVQECWVIKSGTFQPFLLRGGKKTLDSFMGFVGSGAGKLRIYQSSPAGL